MNPAVDGTGMGGPAAVLAFDALTVIDAARLGLPPVDTVAFADLYDYATGDEAADGGRVEAAIRADARLRAALLHLMDRISVARSPQLAVAASGSGPTERAGDRFMLRLRPSRAAGGQVYLHLQLQPGCPPPRNLVVLDARGGACRRSLPPAVDGVVQILLAGDDPLLAAVADPDATVHLA